MNSRLNVKHINMSMSITSDGKISTGTHSCHLWITEKYSLLSWFKKRIVLILDLKKCYLLNFKTVSHKNLQLKVNLKDALFSFTIPEETSNVDNPESFHTLGKYVITFSLVAIPITAIQSRSILYSYLAFIRHRISY